MTNRTISLQPLHYRCGTKMTGHVAVDESQSGLRPGILVVHDAWGVGENVKLKARMLAELGYVALAVDIYGDGIAPRTPDEARAQLKSFQENAGLLRERAACGLRALADLPQVDSTRLGAIGYCFGGMTVLEMARGGSECLAVVSFHGTLTTSQPAVAGVIKSKLLVCTGAEDLLVPMEHVAGLQQEMRAARADCQIVIYSGAQHGFANPFSRSLPGIAHHPIADRRSWAAMRRHFDEAFGAGETFGADEATGATR
jgi:dienelactone hydrolase